MIITDVHTHTPFLPGAICSGSPEQVSQWLTRSTGGIFSVGIHPWDTESVDCQRLERDIELMRTLCADPRVVAVGECGLDKLKGAPMEWQKVVFMRQALLAEELGKPVVLHAVRSHEELLSLRREIEKGSRASAAQSHAQPWIWHGFRGNERVARRILASSPLHYLSVGEKFNEDAVRSIPVDRLLVETDESTLTINEIAARIALTIGISRSALQRAVQQNIQGIFSI